MKKITCVGYHATGAGVIDDLFREFDNVVQGHYEAECRILHDADGVSDLEYHLVENPHRLKTEIAIERFLRYAEENRREYEKTFGKEWIPLCKEYVNSLAKFKYFGYSTRCIRERSPYYRYNLLLKKIINRLKPKSIRHPTWYNYFPNEEEYHVCLTDEEFIQKTKVFTEKLCSLIPHTSTTEYTLIDQMIPGDYTERYFRYVNDLQAIVVDRDPRDLYIHNMIHGDHALPKDPHQFCIHFRDIRRKRGFHDPNKVMYVTFEDMIYNYDEMVRKVLDFIGISLEHHVSPQTHFVPSKSIQGTKLWEKYPEYADAVRIIERELPEYLYHYPVNN